MTKQINLFHFHPQPTQGKTCDQPTVLAVGFKEANFLRLANLQYYLVLTFKIMFSAINVLRKKADSLMRDNASNNLLGNILCQVYSHQVSIV